MIESSQDMTKEVEEDSAIKVDEFGIYYRKIEAPENYNEMVKRYEEENELIVQKYFALGGLPLD